MSQQGGDAKRSAHAPRPIVQAMEARTAPPSQAPEPVHRGAVNSCINCVGPPGVAARNRAQPSLRQDQPVPSRASKQPALPPVQGKKGSKARAEEPQDGLVASHWPDGIPKQAMYALGFDGSRQMFGHVLDMQNREEEFALVRAHQRHVGSMLLETWLDDALAHDRISDSTSLQIGSMQRQGLQTYGIARNQLKGTGLCDMQVDRLHRSLYVYSVGFGDMLQDCIAHISNRDAVLLNVWQAYNKISEAAVIVGFKSSILDMVELKEAQAAQLLMMRDSLTESQGDTANLQKTLAVITGAHLEECAERQTLKAEADALRETAAAEKEAHGHAIRQYVVEVELRSQLQSQVAEERSAKEHAVFLRSVAEKKILQLQEEVDGQKMCIEQLDAQVSKTTNALAMEQALATASQMQKTTVEERMARLIDQIETMHRKWKEEQEARMQRQNEMYARADELRQARVQLIQSNAATRVMQADNSRLSSTVEELSTQLELLQRRVAEGEAALTVEERRAREARAALDRKRQKKRAHKATAIKFQQLWQKFNAELNNTNARLAEEVEASADMVARSEKAERSMAEMALGLSVAVKACTAQKAARCSLKRKLEEKERYSTKLARERDVANLQVDCKAKQIAELNDAIERATHEVKGERGRTSDVEHMLEDKRKMAAKLRDDLDSAWKQLSDDKEKLCSAVKHNSVLTAQIAEIKVDVDSVKSKLATKHEELSDASSRFDRLQGSKERVEAELLQVVKQRREAQLSWTEKRTDLEGRLQDAKDQIQAAAEEQKAVDQENQRLERELAVSAEVLEAKRAKKRKWKAKCMTNDSNTAELRQQLKDKQFAVEKAMQRFTALEARIEAGTQLKADSADDDTAPKLRNVADLESMLAQKQSDCSTLQKKLQAAKEEEGEAQSILNSSIQDPNSTEEQLSVAKDALEIKASIVRQAQARVESCQEKIALILDEIGGHGTYSDTESQVLSMVGFQVQELVLDWTLEMLLASESRMQHATERHTQLEATIRQLTMTNKDVEGRKSNAETTVQNMNRRLRDKMTELEQLRKDLAVSNKSRDKIQQEMASAKEDARQVGLLLKESKREAGNAKQQLLDSQKSEKKLTAKMEQAKKAEIAQLQQQHAAATKKRDQQIKTLLDSRTIIEKQLEQANIEKEQVANQYLAAGKDASIAGWIREIEDDSAAPAGADITGKALNLYDPLIPELKLSPTLLLTLIAQIYLEKIASDRVRERQDNEPLDFPPPMTGDLDEALIRPNPCSRKTLEHFVYDFFLARIGNRMLAEVHLAALYSSIVRLRTESRKIYMFGRLLGIFDAIPQGGDDFFLATLSRIHSTCGPLIQEAFAGNSLAGVEELAKVARSMFKGTSEYLCEAAMSITDRLRKVADLRSQQLGVDLVLHIMMETWLEQRQEDKAKVDKVFEQALPAGGILTQDDFKAMMRCINLELSSLLPDRVVTDMYREGLQLSAKGHRITGDAFFQVIHAHGVVGLKTHRLNCVEVEISPPWDEFKLVDESWSGMRCSIEETISGDEHIDDEQASYYSSQLRAVMDTFIEKKADLRDPDGTWQAYRRLLRTFTAVKMDGSGDGNEAPQLSAESSNRSMRHAPVFNAPDPTNEASPRQHRKSESGQAGQAAAPKQPEAPQRLIPTKALDPKDPGFRETDLKRKGLPQISSIAQSSYKVDCDILDSDL